mgnify:FL=1
MTSKKKKSKKQRGKAKRACKNNNRKEVKQEEKKRRKTKQEEKKQRGKQKCFPRLCKTESGLINIHRMQHIRPSLDAGRETAGNDDVVAFVCRAACKRHGLGYIFKTVETPES